MRSFISVFVLLAVLSFSALAEIAFFTDLYGDEKQPGKRLHEVIVSHHLDQNKAKSAAISDAVAQSISDTDTTLGGEAKSAVAFDVPHAEKFYDFMTERNSLIDVTKRLIEHDTSKAVHSITLAVVLYPDHAQEIYDGAALTGVLSQDDLTIAMLQAGADPSSFSDATAAAGDISNSVIVGTSTVNPLGAGIGAGGTGGGDRSASTN